MELEVLIVWLRNTHFPKRISIEESVFVILSIEFHSDVIHLMGSIVSMLALLFSLLILTTLTGFRTEKIRRPEARGQRP